MNELLKVTPILDVYAYLTGNRVNARGTSVSVPCAIHLERNPSMSLDLERNVFYCFHDEVGGSVAEMIRLSKFPDDNGPEGFRKAYEVLRNLNNLEPQERREKQIEIKEWSRPRLLDANRTIYPFVDAHGVTLYDEVRIDGIDPEMLEIAHANGLSGNEARTFAKAKQVFQRRHLPKGRWLTQNGRYVFYDMNGKTVPYGPDDPSPISLPTHDLSGRPLRAPSTNYLYGRGALTGLPKVLFRLPSVHRAARENRVVIMTEGSKKAYHVLTRLGITGTALAGGAEAELTLEHALDLNGVVGFLRFADSDPKGIEAAIRDAKTAAQVVPDARVIDFFGDNSKRDYMQWLDLMGRLNKAALLAELQKLADNALSFTSTGTRANIPFPDLAARA